MRKSYSAFLFIVGIGTTTAWADSSADIPFSKRTDTVEFAKTLLFTKPGVVQPAGEGAYKNPFSPTEVPTSPSSSVPAGETMVSTPGEIVQLAQIAPNITPSGTVRIGSEAFLLFGQKRFKVLDHLPIIFEGKSYDLEIVEIQSTSFTLRLNGVEITRPIKSVTKPVIKP